MPLGLALLSLTGAFTAAGAQQQPPARGQRKVQPDTANARRRLEQQLGRPVTQAELVERLRQSGMTRAQARARLQQAGYDPSVADQYFDVLERGGEPQRGVAEDSSVEALQRIGVTIPGLPSPLPRDTLRGGLDSLALRDSVRAMRWRATAWTATPSRSSAWTCSAAPPRNSSRPLSALPTPATASVPAMRSCSCSPATWRRHTH